MLSNNDLMELKNPDTYIKVAEHYSDMQMKKVRKTRTFFIILLFAINFFIDFSGA